MILVIIKDLILVEYILASKYSTKIISEKSGVPTKPRMELVFMCCSL